MKKLILVLVIVLSLVLVACFDEDDYYNKIQSDEIQAEQVLQLRQLELQIATLQTMIDELQQTITRLEADPTRLVLTDTQRYILSILSGEIPVQFISAGTVISGVVEGYDYYYLVLEITTETTFQIDLLKVAPNGDWDINIYPHNTLYEADYSFQNIVNNQRFTITMPPGFVTIEFDSYADEDFEFEILITEVVVS